MNYNRKKFNLTHYLVIGPENTLGRDTLSIIKEAIEAGISFIQIRAKNSDPKEIIELTNATASLIQEMKKADDVSLVVNDRLDIVLACREMGYKVDGIHVGQTDIPVDLCRKYLGEDSIVGLSASSKYLIDYVENADTSAIDYFGAGPLHPTDTKKDAGRYDGDDQAITLRTFSEIETLAQISPIPVVIGGGVKVGDLPELYQTGIDGYFVISAIASASNPYLAAKELVDTWTNLSRENK
ncbi:thiamine phosphate synthase [Fundicoccus sp. Sow4_H7]|uniref:thiamine phosphate synthase n=1 Tax=Fundicoccus sp. Sow4_H7 TaxID=3438784 RepID=UPI003F93E113